MRSLSLALAIFLVLITLPAVADEKYVVRGFAHRDAALAALLLLPAEQQVNAELKSVSMSKDCRWTEPWLLIHRGRDGEKSGASYDVWTVPVEDEWAVAWWDRSHALVIHTTDAKAPFVVIRWSGPHCVGMP